MDHGIDARHRRDFRGQSQSQIGIQDGNVGKQDGGADSGFCRLAGRDHGHGGHLGARAGGSWDQNQRQTITAHLINAIEFGQRLRAAQQNGDNLGDIHGTAAADGNHALDPRCASGVRRREDHLLRRVLGDLREQRHRNASFNEGVLDRSDKPDTHEPGVRHQQNVTDPEVPAALRKLQRLSGTTDYASDTVEYEGFHERYLKHRSKNTSDPACQGPAGRFSRKSG